MNEKNKVFSSNITRGQKCQTNNLEDLIKIIPAIPSTPRKERQDHKCEFQPRNDKYYVPKKRNKLKVKTVRNIRDEFEKDVYSTLPEDLEIQYNAIFKKVTGGSSKNDNTKTFAKNVLKSENPISRSSWQMLMNLNPEEQAHCVQYILCNGQRIRVNGSKGGKYKFLCNFDLGRKYVTLRTKKTSQKKKHTKKKMLLHNSLTVKFKPGPLTKKKFLDDSYQRYNVGSTELVKLPKLGLDIQPSYGLVLEPFITNFLQNLNEKDGTISEKWADFAVSVLGSRKNCDVVQNDPKACVSFDLNYKSNQRRILMRRDIDSESKINNVQDDLLPVIAPNIDESSILPEIKIIVERMLDAVEINAKQDQIFSGVDEQRDICSQDINYGNNNLTKDKVKRNIELERLDVTIIRLPDAPQEESSQICLKSHCALGCVCASLQNSCHLKQHCGRVDCMFECKCDFSKYKLNDSIENSCPELIPGILNLSNEVNLKLAKEEQKFHQTVVMAGEKSILMRPQRRNWKASKKYADFYQNLSLKTGIKQQPILSVEDIKLNLDNVEPWCMVHSLYKCFCKGRFTENSTEFASHYITLLAKPEKTENEGLLISQDEVNETSIEESDREIDSLRSYPRPSRIKRNLEVSGSSNSVVTEHSTECARTRSYQGRKYHDSYYSTTNKKIEELEKNDQSLYKRMMTLINRGDLMITKNRNSGNLSQNASSDEKTSKNQQDLSEDEIVSENNDSTCSSKNIEYFNRSANKEDNQSIICDENSNSSQFLSDNVFSEMISSQLLSEEISANQTTANKTSQSKRLPNKTKLVAWLESSYKLYKQRLDRGIVKTALEPPKEGKIALYPWEFILSRYRERKNLFLISKQKPFRIFMAVDMKNPLFKNCINIDDIRFADLHKYPITVKNLLTNATDLKDIFFILSGLACCWEVIGSVTKISEPKDSDSKESESETVDSTTVLSLESESMALPSKEKIIPECTEEHMELDIPEPVTCDDKESSKWFVMTIENDFCEIKFYKRGFFVKYESIIKAINVARMTGKTVRLSSQKTADCNDGPQFGIYAIPNVDEYSVFVGPYDKDENLDLETVKSVSDVGKPKNTRGVWITTKKVDNLKVIDNPLSFMPNSHASKMLTFESEAVQNTSKTNVPDGRGVVLPETKSAKNAAKKNPEEPKMVKPIKIRKTNNFYPLKSQSLLKPLPQKVVIPKMRVMQQGSTDKNQCILFKNTVPTINPPLLQNLPSNKCEPWPYRIPITDENNKATKPIAEIAPQIKIIDVYSEATTTPRNEVHESMSRRREKGMFILKPEEINKKVLNRQTSDSETSQSFCSSDVEINEDIEKFLATSKICTPPNPNILVNEEETGFVESKNLVFIECKTVENLGWIPGIRDCNNKISFQFPGFKYTLFYAEEEAFSKINQVLSRKVYVPKNIKLEWQVLESEENLKTKTMLTTNHLGIDFVLTKRGLRHKRDLIASAQVLSKPDYAFSSSSSNDTGSTVVEACVDKATELFNELEEENKKIEEESNQLLNTMKEREATLIALRESKNGQK